MLFCSARGSNDDDYNNQRANVTATNAYFEYFHEIEANEGILIEFFFVSEEWFGSSAVFSPASSECH